MNIKRRTSAYVHLDRLERNVKRIQGIIGASERKEKPVELIAVLKGDAYGHGIAGVYPALKNCGVKNYAVAVWEEGVALRNAGAKSERIMLLGDTWDDHLPKLINYNLIPAIYSLKKAQKMDAAAAAAGVIHPVQIKIDTGMNRIGFQSGEPAVEAIKQISMLNNIHIAGIFTHFGRADEVPSPTTEECLNKYLNTIEAAKNYIPDDAILHSAGSPAIMLHENTHLDAVRAGDLLFGLCPVDEDIYEKEGFEDVMTWETYVAMVKTVPTGVNLGYGTSFTTEKEMRVATLPVGFADGFDRRLSNGGHVIINGHRATICGKICMDQCIVDVTDIPEVEYGDKVTLLGSGMSILDRSKEIDCTVDEVVCTISPRVPRIYVD